MNIKKTLFVLVLGSLLFPGLVATQAATDQAPGSIDWSSISETTYFWYAGSDDKPAKFNVKMVDANSSLIHEHVSSDADSRVAHLHLQYGYGEDSSQSDANVINANKFWDAYQYADARFREADALPKHRMTVLPAWPNCRD